MGNKSEIDYSTKGIVKTILKALGKLMLIVLVGALKIIIVISTKIVEYVEERI
jgi:hypothetical protein